MFYFKLQVCNFTMALIFRLDNHPQKTSRSFEFNFHRLFAAMYLESRNLKILFLQLFPSYFCRNRPSTCSFLLMPLDVAATTTRSKFFSTTSNSPPLYYAEHTRCLTMHWGENLTTKKQANISKSFNVRHDVSKAISEYNGSIFLWIKNVLRLPKDIHSTDLM